MFSLSCQSFCVHTRTHHQRTLAHNYFWIWPRWFKKRTREQFYSCLVQTFGTERSCVLTRISTTLRFASSNFTPKHTQYVREIKLQDNCRLCVSQALHLGLFICDICSFAASSFVPCITFSSSIQPAVRQMTILRPTISVVSPDLPEQPNNLLDKRG